MTNVTLLLEGVDET
jgi:hypothetical protein